MHKQDNIHKLSDNLGATYDEKDSSIVLWDTRGYSVRRVESLAAGEVNELMTLYVNGCCPVCLIEIPQGDIVCDSCLDDALRNRNASGVPTQYMHTLMTHKG